MISVEEAKSLISARCAARAPAYLPLIDAAGLSLAEDVHAPVSLPPFRQSSMDGYAVIAEDLAAYEYLTVSDVIPAGSRRPVVLKNGEAARIFTGAPLPVNADTVVMQERVTVNEKKISLSQPFPREGENTRSEGAEIVKGALALKKGSRMTPSAIGYLAGMGLATVPVYPKVRVALLVTGNELRRPGESLEPGEVYESSSFALLAALKDLPAEITTVTYAPDEIGELTRLITAALGDNDLLLITGGVSVGDFDFTANACREAGVECVFHRVKQRPGKPLYFGLKGECQIFGMPGNPSSVLTCFYQYVVPAIEKRTGTSSTTRRVIVPLSAGYSKNAGLTHFLKGHYNGTAVEQAGAQESYRLSSFATSNCLIVVPEETEVLHAGDNVSIYLLNN